MAVAAQPYYRVRKRTVHGCCAFLVLVLVGLPLVVWASAPTWLPQVPALLDADQPIANPDVIVLKSAGESDDAVKQAAEMLRAGRVGWVAMLGLPFTPDDLAKPAHSPRYDDLLAAGAPAGRVVEIYQGEDIYGELDAFRDAAAQHGWRRALFYLDALGSRRNLIASRRALGEAGIEVGQRTFPLTWFDAATWWHGGTARTIVAVRVVQLAFTMLSNRT